MKLILIIIIVFIGLALRIINLDQSLWLDEAISVNVARDFSFVKILSEFAPGDFHPPAYYILLKAWISVFGSSEVSARGLSVLFGVGTIPVLYIIGKRLFSKNIGLGAALLLSVSPLHIYYSQEARMYVLATFFAAVLFYFLISVLRNQRFSSWIGLFISILLLLYTDYPPVFFVISLAIYLLLFERSHLKHFWKYWVSGAVLLSFTALPWLPTFLEQVNAGARVKTEAPAWWNTLGRTSIKELFLVPVKFTIGRISFFNKIMYTGVLLPPLLVNAFFLFKSLFLFNKTKIVWFWLVPPIVLAGVAGFFGSGFSYFRLIFVLPAFYLLIVYGVYLFKKPWILIGVLFIINLAFSFLYLSEERYHREDWRGAVSWIEGLNTKNTSVVFSSRMPLDPYRYYAKSVPALGRDEAVLAASSDTIILVRYVQPILDPEEMARKALENAGFKKVEEKDFNGVVLWKYENRY